MGEGTSAGGGAVGSSGPDNVSPPGPVYQGGDLSHFEQTSETGVHQMETEEQDSLPPPLPPMLPFAGHGSSSQPNSGMAGSWLPYPYDYMFVTGQYPPGTFSHSSSSNEQGSDSWQDVHYMRNLAPYNPSPGLQTETSAVYQSFKAIIITNRLYSDN